MTQPTRQPIIRCSIETEPTITVRSRIPASAEWTAHGPTVEDDAFEARPVQEPCSRARGRAPRWPPTRRRSPPSRSGTRRYEEERAGRGPDGGAQRVEVESPLAALDVQRDEPRHGADEPDAVEHAGVGRVGEDHLVARVGQAEERVEHRVALAAGDDDLAAAVVRGAAAPLDQVRDGLLELVAGPVNGSQLFASSRRPPRGSPRSPPPAAACRCRGSRGAAPPGRRPPPPRRGRC